MKSILKSIAEAYVGRYKDLSKVCFLFPNKRCGVFLKDYLLSLSVRKKKLPVVKTITEFISDISGLTEAGKIDAIFTLYNCYQDLLIQRYGNPEEVKIDFDDFRSWGETVLADFNTVDQYLVNAKEIFKNVTDFRNLTSNFLTDDQKEVLKDYFGYDQFDESDSFWKSFEDIESLSPLKKRFINLWQILGKLHEVFLFELSKKGSSTTGGLYRKAVEQIEISGKDILPYKKIVVFGFNAINGAERYRTIYSSTAIPRFQKNTVE